MDPRIEKLADVMVNYSLELKEGQNVKIKGSPQALPLVKAFYKKALQAGAHPYYWPDIEDLEELLYKHGSDAQLKYIPEIQKLEVDKMDALLGIFARNNTKYLSNVDPSRQALAQSSRQSLMTRFMERAAAGELSWCGTMFPVHSAAQDADMSLSEYEEFVFGAGHLNDDDPVAHWKAVSAKQSKICSFLESLKEIKVKSKGTDLTVKVEGRKWENCDGKNNFPDGEVFTAPHETSAEGEILYSFPACYQGHEVAGVKLKFKEGRVVDYSADKNIGYLEKMIDMDDGARLIGEFAIGTNYNVQNFTKNILFDEKIGGTMHIALGQAYPETGGKNKSGLHWDMVCDLREGGQLIGDGEVFYKDGKFIKEF
jgi:aminopeptidase